MGAVDLKIKHKAEHILESNDKQFVSKAEKDKWNNCQGGSGDVDLSNYYTKDQVDAEISKVKALMAGVKFTIEAADWTAEDSKFKYVLAHGFDIPLESTSVTFYNEQNENVMLDYTYIDSNTIHIYSDERVKLYIVIKQIVEVEVQVDLTNYYTKQQTDSQIQTKVDDLVGAAPDALDTLKELGDALGNDANFSTTVTNLIAEKAPKVHKHKVEDIEGINDSMPRDWGKIEEEFVVPSYDSIINNHKEFTNHFLFTTDGQWFKLILAKEPLFFGAYYHSFADRMLADITGQNGIPMWVYVYTKENGWYPQIKGENRREQMCSLRGDHSHQELCDYKTLYINFKLLYNNHSNTPSELRGKEVDVNAYTRKIDVQLKRGETSKIQSVIGKSGELIVDTTKKTVTVHDGSTPGGTPLAKEVHSHPEYVTEVDLQRTYVPFEISKPTINATKSNIYEYTIKGKTISSNSILKSVGEDEDNKILVDTVSSMPDNVLTQETMRLYMLANGGIDFSTGSGSTGPNHIDIGVYNKCKLCASSFFKTNTQYLFVGQISMSPNVVRVIVKYKDSSTEQVFNYSCGWVSPPANIRILTDAGRTVEWIRITSTSDSTHTRLFNNAMKLMEYRATTSTEIQLTEPLRSTLDLTVRDEIIGNKLIRRVEQIGNTINVLESPKITKLSSKPIYIYDGLTTLSLLNEIEPFITFKYPEGKLGIFDKLEDDVFSIKNNQSELFQSVSSGKTLLETAITDKGGTVSKVGSVATFEELKAGIEGITTNDPDHVCREEGKQELLDVMIQKLPSLQSKLTVDSPLTDFAFYLNMIGEMLFAFREVFNGVNISNIIPTLNDIQLQSFEVLLEHGLIEVRKAPITEEFVKIDIPDMPEFEKSLLKTTISEIVDIIT